MGSGPSVPDDIRGHVAKYVPDRAPFLALRAASKFERDAVQRTIARRPGAVRRFGFYPRWADGETLAWEPGRAAHGVRGVFINDRDARQGVWQGRHSFIGLRPRGAGRRGARVLRQADERRPWRRWSCIAPTSRRIGSWSSAARVRASRSCGRRCMRSFPMASSNSRAIVVEAIVPPHRGDLRDE